MPARDEVQVWIEFLDIENDERRDLLGLLSTDEVDRANAFRFEHARDRFIAARGKLRTILSAYTGEEASKLSFQYSEYGKPSLKGDHAWLTFNLSHSGALAVYAIAQLRNVGIDLERIQTGLECSRIAECFLAAHETRTLRSLAPQLQREAFFHCWARKEAYLKAIGRGLSIPLDSFEVTLAPEEPAQFVRGVSGWSLYSIAIPGYALAIAAEGDHCRVTTASLHAAN